MKPTTLLGTLILLSTWSSVGATETGTYSVQKADNRIEQRIAAARSNDSWSPFLKKTTNKLMDIAAWGNGRGRGWANGGGGGGGFGNARGGGWGNGGGGFANARYRGGFANW